MSWEAFLGLPSPEHRRHIRRFHRSDLTNEQDVALMSAAAENRQRNKTETYDALLLGRGRTSPIAPAMRGWLMHTTSAGHVSTTRSLQSPVIAAQRLANVDFGERISPYLSC